MASSSFLSKGVLCAAASTALCAAAGVSAALGAPSAAEAAAVLGALSGAASLGLAVKSRRDEARLCDAFQKAADGDLNLRLVGWQGKGSFSALACGFNRLLDQAEAFAREAQGTLRAAAAEQFHRRILPQGLAGDFGRAASVLDGAREGMMKASEDLAGLDRSIALFARGVVIWRLPAREVVGARALRIHP